MDWINGLKGGPFSDKQTARLHEALSELDDKQLQWLGGYLAAVNTANYKPQANNSTLSKEKPAGKPLWILYGTHTGNCEELAKQMAARGQALGLETNVVNMAKFKPRELKQVENLAVIVSTHGIGEPPIQAEELYNFLHGKKAPKLAQVRFSVLALGDTSYAQFCQTGRDFDAVLEKVGAQRVFDRVDCDVDFEEDAQRWIDGALEKFCGAQVKVEASLKFPVVNGHGHAAAPLFSRKKPFEAEVLEKINLNGRGSAKETIHIELNLEGSGLTYEPGDAVGIYAPNSLRLVESVLELVGLSGEEEVETDNGRKKLSDALALDFELTPLTSVSLSRYCEITGSKRLRKILDDNEAVAAYLRGRDVLDLFKETPCKITPEQLVSVLRKNSPRLYSIASCQGLVDDEVHLLAGVVRYESYGRYREGHCSGYMGGRLNAGDKVKVFIDRNSRFKLPQDSETPVIMVGPGTGIAPFRAFIQQKELEENRGKSWLFFGDRNFTTDFLYQSEWLDYLKDGVLSKLDVAFSRDQQDKIYVQHKMLEKGRELYDWLESGANFYVCGDAERMAKDVDKTLKEIVQVHGGLSKEKADEYVKYLQVSDRYLTDVY